MLVNAGIRRTFCVNLPGSEPITKRRESVGQLIHALFYIETNRSEHMKTEDVPFASDLEMTV